MTGFVEQLSVREISGWTDAERVEILINGVVRGIAIQTGSRQDCIEAGYANARGLYFRPTRYLVPGVNSVSIRDAVNLESLECGDQLLTYDPLQAVDLHWSTQYSGQDYVVSRWWQCEQIVRHVNVRICGESAPDILTGIRRWIANEYFSKLPLRIGVSVGCGQGAAEMEMIKSGIVREFDLFDLSSFAISAGTQQAAAQGLGAQMHFVHGNAFEICTEPEKYDFVFWQQALHHMPDVDVALAWSREVLRPGGVFLMHEYVGPTRFQFSRDILDINSELRRSLHRKYLANPWSPGGEISAEVVNIDLDELLYIDPSEGMDSERILPCLTKYFPTANIRATGGMIYHLGLNDILHNLVADGAFEEIARALAIDDALIEAGKTQYAVALAVK